MHVQSCCFANLSLLLYYRFRERRRRGGLSSPLAYIRITMSCTLVFVNGNRSGWERRESTVASGSPALFEHKHVPSKFIYVKKSTYY